MSEDYCEHYDLPKSSCAHCRGLDNTEVEEVKTAVCRECGADNVTWRVTKAGNWCLFNVNTSGEVSSMPHFKTCSKKWDVDGEIDFI